MRARLDPISAYIYAKDGNRPWLLRHAFTADAELAMVVNTDAIAFPASARGIDALADIVVRRFAREFENVYTFCLTVAPKLEAPRFSCDWLVGMSGKDGGEIRVGCGRSDWQFRAGNPYLAERLTITIELMPIFPPDRLEAIMTWLSASPYPWCPGPEATRHMPELPALAAIAAYIKRDPQG